MKRKTKQKNSQSKFIPVATSGATPVRDIFQEHTDTARVIINEEDTTQRDEIFARITQKTAIGERITDLFERTFLNEIIYQTFQYDSWEDLQTILGWGIVEADLGHYAPASFAQAALRQQAPECLRVCFERDPTLSLNSVYDPPSSYDKPTTFLLAAAERSSIEVIEYLVDHAKAHNTPYDKNNLLYASLKNGTYLNNRIDLAKTLLAVGASPYSADNHPAGQNDEVWFNSTEDSVFSLFFKCLDGPNVNVENHIYPALIQYMDDLDKLLIEKEIFEKILDKGWSGLQGRDEEILKLMNDKIKVLAEKNMLTAHIALGSGSGSDLVKTKTVKI